jgi:opacity protein-like surface antigen
MRVQGWLVLLAAVFLSSAAWATVIETGTTLKTSGQPIAGKTLTVEFSQPAPRRSLQQTSTSTRVVVHKIKVTTDENGRVKFTYDDSKIDPRIAALRFIGYGGLVSDYVPLSGLGQVVDLGSPGTTTSTLADTPTLRSVATFDWNNGFYFGLQLSGSPAWDQRITERIAGMRFVTNRLYDTQQAGGVGVVGGFDWNPGFYGMTFGPVASFNYIGQANDHTFTGGGFIGTYLNWNATIGGRLGWRANDRILLYATGGAEFMNYDFRSNFTGPVLSINHTATGWFAGGGVEYTQPDWRTMNGQWSAFGQITYSEFCGELFRMPAFSPGFDYKVASDQVRVTAGFTFRPSWSARPIY